MIITLLVILVILAFVGSPATPGWNWGWPVSGGLGLLVLILVILAVTGVLGRI